MQAHFFFVLNLIMYSKASSLYLVALMTFFFTLFDGTLAYIIPLEVTGQGLSKTTLGLILGTSSIAGAVGDIFLSKILTNSNFRRLFLIMYAFCFGYVLLLWQANTLVMYLVAMVLWGLYFDFKNFATFNFVGRYTPHRLHASSFGVIDIFKCLGYFIAPLLAGLLIVDTVTEQPFIMALLFLGFSVIVYIALIFQTRKNKEHLVLKKKNYGILLELQTWQKLSKFLLPVLIFTLMINIYDSFFWTVGPLISEELSSINRFGGLFLTFYFFPAVIVGWFVGSTTKRFGKKRTAFVSFAIGAGVLSLVGLVSNSWIVLLVVLLSSFFTALAWPAIHGSYADYIEESPHLEQEIEGVSDFFYNIAYATGPIMAGILADNVGNTMTLTTIGIAGVTISVILLLITPKHIRVPAKI